MGFLFRWASIAATAFLIRFINLPDRIHQLRLNKQFYYVVSYLPASLFCTLILGNAYGSRIALSLSPTSWIQLCGAGMSEKD